MDARSPHQWRFPTGRIISLKTLSWYADVRPNRKEHLSCLEREGRNQGLLPMHRATLTPNASKHQSRHCVLTPVRSISSLQQLVKLSFQPCEYHLRVVQTQHTLRAEQAHVQLAIGYCHLDIKRCL